MNMIQHSEEIKAGLRQGFRDGTSKLAQRKCYGYEVSADGELAINKKEAEVVRWIFEQYAEGKSLGKIADGLARQGIPSPTGKPKWNREAIDRLLANEKYTGRVLLQKTAGGRDNPGYEDRYLYHDTHEAIISDELFQAAQEERLQRSRNPEKTLAMSMTF
ncbi:MAG: recombinase family protein [Oscillospiraceae bacterium]|nr:recombinase family protein [Oscillospiraceae bacterium]